MEAQNYANHSRYVTGYHKVLGVLLLIMLIGSIVNLCLSWGDHQRIYSASLITLLVIIVIMTAFYARGFALMAQDRVIRAEENMRHYLTTGKPLPSELTMRQVVGLRFAGDDEFAALVQKAIQENLSEKQIKKAITNWRGDYERV